MDRRDFVKTACIQAAAAAVCAGPALEAGGENLNGKARALVAKMTLDEKIALMAGEPTLFTRVDRSDPYRTNNTPGCERLGIPGIRFVDGSRGIRFEGATCFPAAIARGATWDPELEERVGNVIGYEGRAGGANFFGGVCINLLRHPSWGRSQETFGEDPFHLGRMGSAVVRGVQKHMMACTKHFAGNSIDRSRHWVDVRMDERTLREIYLPHFKACVDAGTASIMNAYNTLNGVPCAHNKRLLREILNQEWGFEGFVLSDFGSMKRTILSANAGCSVEMDRRLHYDWKLKLAVLAGRVPESNINEAVTRIIGQQLRFIHLEKSADYDIGKLGSPEHASVAREVANKSMVLLKNENQTLPLDRAKIKSIAVIGELANKVNLGATGSTAFNPSYVVVPLEGIKRAAGESIDVVYEDGGDMAAAERAAASADAVLVVAGLTYKDENEGNDRLRLSLSDEQEHMIGRMAAVNPRCIVAVIAGGAVTMEAWRKKVPAILMAWYSGMEGGNAMADIIFGDVNPSGKLPIVFPKSKDQLPEFDNISPVVKYGYYHGYRWFDKHGLEPAIAFGYGLSYTSYRYDNLQLADTTITRDGVLKVSVEVTNTGELPGEEVVQMYVGYKGSRVDRPVKDLKGFTRVSLDPGEKKSVSLALRAQDLAYYDVGSAGWKIEELEYILYLGSSSRREDLLEMSFSVKG